MSALLSRYGYTFVVSFASAMLTFPFGFFRQSAEDVSHHPPATFSCGHPIAVRSLLISGLRPCCQVCNTLFGAAPLDLASRWSQPSLIGNLLIFVVCKFIFTVIALACPIACGVFTPNFLIGAAFGRCFGEILNVYGAAVCEPTICQPITAGAYAVVGAAAYVSGVTRTISPALMVLELTGQLEHLLPVLAAVLCAYGTANLFNKSIYDTMLELNNLPYLDAPNPQLVSSQTALDVMDAEIFAVNASNVT